ncbi:MAG: S8 family serine peptidase, partial [Anaerolineae bacterium]|nr:S8 family serine peptidase [Anaerolineae bacterium]
QIQDVTYSNDGLAVTFASAVSGEEPIDYLWSFGDGITSTLADPIHTYPGNGAYTATLGVSNCGGDGSDDWTDTLGLLPEIGVDPLALEATLYPGQAATVTLWLTNDGVVDLSFVLHETGALGLADAPKGGKAGVWDGPVTDPELSARLSSGGRAQAIIYLREQADLSPAYGMADKGARRQFVYDRLQATAERSGGPLVALLETAGAEPRRLLAVNGIAATLDARLAAQVAARPEVAYVALDHDNLVLPALAGQVGGTPNAVEWNIAKIKADQAWGEFGITGQGVVIGEIDTGAMYNHPAIVSQYRGNLGGGTFDHDYNWYDFVNGQPAPYDDNGHGTMGLGVAAGDDGAGNQIGVAPGARWIAAKACSGGGSCLESDLLAAGDWMLAPTRLDGSDPDPFKAPDVVLNMWGYPGPCDYWYDAVMQVWRAANILPIFTAGAGGPSCGSVASPASSTYAVSVGATDTNDLIAPFSGRGPSPCTGEIKPEVTAPGVNIRSSMNDGGYYVWNSTALATAHLAGTAALVLCADPSLSVNQVTINITETALCIEDLSCGGTPCPDGANNVYGWGRIDAFEAVSLTLSGLLFDLPWLSEMPAVGVISPGQAISVAVTFDARGLEPGAYVGLLDVESDDPDTPHVGVPVTLTVEPPPVCYEADILAVIYEKVGCQVTFSAQVTGTEPISLTWEFGPYGTYTEPSPTVDFGVTGSYTGTLTASNCNGVGYDVQSFSVSVECVTIRMIYIPLVVKNF